MKPLTKNTERVIKEFNNFFNLPFSDKKNKYKTYIISEKNHPNKMNDLTALLKLNKIQFGFLASDKPKSIKDAFHYTTGKNKDIKITNDDMHTRGSRFRNLNKVYYLSQNIFI